MTKAEMIAEALTLFERLTPEQQAMALDKARELLAEQKAEEAAALAAQTA